MSSSDAERSRVRRIGRLVCGLAMVGLVTAACTVQPLYGDMTSSTPPPAGSVSALMRSVAVTAPDSRVEQQVRNQLVFMLNGGAGEPARTEYELDLRVVAQRTSGASIQPTTRDLEPTAANILLNANYVLKERGGEVIARGARTAQAAFDIPRQAFAEVRAQRDAEDRAARELAEILRLTLAQEFRRPGGPIDEKYLEQPEQAQGPLDIDQDDDDFFR